MTSREAILKMNIYELLCFYQCPECIQAWLNSEADQPKPIRWQDAMMKNFLREETYK